MIRSKGFVKVSKKGGLVNVVKEHYLRDDIRCGIEGCMLCPAPSTAGFLLGEDATQVSAPSSGGGGGFLSRSPHNGTDLVPHPHYLVLDTNVYLHQMDVLEHPVFTHVIVPQTVLAEVQHQQVSHGQRLKTLLTDKRRHYVLFSNEHHRETYVEQEKGEIINDRNDRAIRKVAEWYARHVDKTMADLEAGERPWIVFLTNDQACKMKAKQAGLLSYSLGEYVNALKDYPELIDKMSASSEGFVGEDGDEEGEGTLMAGDGGKHVKYFEYLPMSILHEGIKAERYVTGTLSVSTYNLFEGTITVDVKGKTEQVHLRDRMAMNRAIHGDAVVVELLPRDQWIRDLETELVDNENEEEASVDAVAATPSASSSVSTIQASLKMTGRVVGILRRNWRTCCGSIDVTSLKVDRPGPQWVLFHPMDRRIPKIRMRTAHGPRLLGQRLLVTIDAWEPTQARPVGHFVRSLGASGDKDVETAALLFEHDIPIQDFSADVLACLPPAGPQWTYTPEELAERTDFRHLPICSIDPPGCTDIDDALHILPLPNGHYQVGVHIADVTHFVKPQTALDKEAAHRATTVYLVDRRIDMLPSLLGTNLCSLKSNVERFAFSCVWELDADANILSVQFMKSIIASRASLTYDEAQARLEDLNRTDEVSVSIRLLNGLAKKLRARRMANGALTLASPEVRFKLEHDSQDPVDVEMKALKDTNALVEEFMLLANISVAKQIYAAFPDLALLRRHPVPPEANFESLLLSLATKGMTLDVSSSKALAESLDRAHDPSDPYFNQLLRMMTTRCMMQAVYFCAGMQAPSEYWHYGLACDIYTHFTSPIRRYADVIVHRLLYASLNQSCAPWSGCSKKEIESIADTCNYRHRMAQYAGRSSVELYTYLFFRGKHVEEDAYIVRVMRNGLVVLIPKYGIEGRIPVHGAEVAASLVHDPHAQAFTWQADKTSAPMALASIYQKIRVSLSMEDDTQEVAQGLTTPKKQTLKVTWLDAPTQLSPYLSPPSTADRPATPSKRKSPSL